MTDIRTIQTRLGLKADGVVGEITAAAVKLALDERDSLKAATASRQTLRLQIADKPVSASTAAPVAPQRKNNDLLTPKVALELIGHEAIVQEAYKDSVGVWTWGVGVTSRSGHSVERYKDNPQPIRRCLGIYLWLLQTRYMPDVLSEFAGRDLTEAQFCAALSFHYNTGAIRRASWVDLWLAGNETAARTAIMEYRRPPEIIPRRQKERNLFFDGEWSQDGKALVYPVRKPSYSPLWSGAKRVDVREDIEALLGSGGNG